MILKVFTVYDSKAQAHLQPFFSPAAGLAVRQFGDSVRDPKSLFFNHPSDFTLLEIGQYDDTTAVLTAHKASINLGTALQFKEAQS